MLKLHQNNSNNVLSIFKGMCLTNLCNAFEYYITTSSQTVLATARTFSMKIKKSKCTAQDLVNHHSVAMAHRFFFICYVTVVCLSSLFSGGA